MPVPADLTAREDLTAPPRRPRSRKVSCPLTRSNGDLVGSGDVARAGLGGAPRTSIRTLLLGCSQPNLSPFLPVSFPEPLPTGLFSPQHCLRTFQLLIPDRTLYRWVSPSLMWWGAKWVNDTVEDLLERMGSGAWVLCSLCLSDPHSLPSSPRSLPGPKPCGPGLPGCPSRGHCLHRVCPCLLPWPQP